MRRPSLLRFVLAAALCFAGASCLSPTLPLPPPDVDSESQSDGGLWIIAGTCEKGAIVTVFNDTQGQGVVIEDRARLGKFVVELKADLCDVGWVSQQVGGDGSTESPFVVEPRSSNDTGSSSSCH